MEEVAVIDEGNQPESQMPSAENPIDYDSLIPSPAIDYWLKVVRDTVIGRSNFTGGANNAEASGMNPEEIINLIKNHEIYRTASVNAYIKDDGMMFEVIFGNEIAQITIRKSVYGCSGVLY